MIDRVDHALRTLVGPWLAIPMIVLEVANIMQRGAPYRGEGLWTADWLAIVLFVAGPLAAGAAAIDAARLSRRGIVHLVIVGRHGRRVYLRAIAWCALPLMAVHLLAFLAAIVVGGTDLSAFARLDVLLVLVAQLLAIPWYASLGSLIGRVTTPLAAGLGGSLAGLAAFYALSSGSNQSFELLGVGGATVSRLGLTVETGYVMAQILILLATATVMATVMLTIRRGHRVPTRGSAALVALALVGIAAAPAVAPDTRVVAGPERAPDLCFETDPTTICFHREHARVADAIAEQLNVLVDAAAANGYTALVPERIEEGDRVSVPGEWSFQAPGPALEDRPYDLGEELLQDLLSPTECAAMSSDTDPPGPRYYQNLFSVIITWLSLLDDPQFDEQIELQQELGAQVLDPDQVATIVDGFHRCDLEVPV